jgi:hypothetical protein
MALALTMHARKATLIDERPVLGLPAVFLHVPPELQIVTRARPRHQTRPRALPRAVTLRIWGQVLY